MKQSQRVIKNILAGGLSSTASGLLQLLVVLTIARRLTISEFGVYAFMASLAFVLQRVGDMGVGAILMRDLAIAPEKTGELLGAALSLGWLVTASATVLMFGVIPFLHVDRGVALLTALMGCGGLWQFQCGCYNAALRGREDNELQGLGLILHKVMRLILVIAALSLRTGLAGVVAAYLASNLLQWWYCRWVVIKRYERPRLQFNPTIWKYFITNSVPIGAAGVTRLLGEQADIIILTWLASLREVGFYSGPYKLSTGLRFITQGIVIALFPVYSRAADSSGSTPKFREMYERGVRGFVLMASPVAVLLFVSSHALTVGFLGARYSGAAPALRLLAIGAWLYLVAQPFPYLLTALNEQRFLFVSSTLAVVTRTALDLALVPSMGFLGPCIAVMAGEGLLVTLCAARLWCKDLPLPLAEISWRPAVGSAVLGITLYICDAQSLSLLALAATAGIGLYLAVIIKLGAFSEAELEMAKEGMAFIRPFVTEWSRQLRAKT